MAGTKRITVGDITQGKLRGSALVDALARGLNSSSAAQVPKKGK